MDTTIDVADDTDAQAEDGADDTIPPDEGVGDAMPPDAGDDDTAGPANACLNESDQALLEGGDDAVKQQATDCAIECINQSDRQTCTAECTADNTDVSDQCAACYSDVPLCMLDNCLNTCLMDPNSESCIGCQEQNGCFAAFNDCAGFDFISEQ